MRFYRNLLLTSVCLLISIVLSANEYPVAAISDSLTYNAVAVVRNYNSSFVQENIANATYNVAKVVTILNKQGRIHADFNTYGDKFTELKGFSGVIRDASGKIIKKIKKSDLGFSSITTGSTIASDDYTIFYEAMAPSYPFTVEYNYQVKFKNGIIAYPSFAPCGYNVSVEKASFSIDLPDDMTLRYRSNYDCNIDEKQVNGRNLYSLSIQNLKSVPYEVLAPSFRELLPRVLLAPSDFCFDSECGNMSSWNNYGMWVSKLLKNRDKLPQSIINKLYELIEDIKDDREKVKIIYQYLQDNSRYVSIQMGIGGFQPAEAKSVSELGFGDCKGLSNLMKAMLQAIDIPSQYCEISMKEKMLYPEFSNVSQTDHAILLVPLQNDSIWLECTSQTLPFGYIHRNIAGHNALVVLENGAKLCRLPLYSDSLNLKITKLDINIYDDAKVDGRVSFTEYLVGYERAVSKMMSNNRSDQISYINTCLKFPQIELGKIERAENRTSLPSCNLVADFQSTSFVNKTGTRLFVPLSPINKGELNIFSSEKRSWDIEIENGFREIDSIVINFPEIYSLEGVVKDVEIQSEIGAIKTKCTASQNRIMYTQILDIYSGRYDRNKYNEIKYFFEQLKKIVERRLVLKKR